MDAPSLLCSGEAVNIHHLFRDPLRPGDLVVIVVGETDQVHVPTRTIVQSHLKDFVRRRMISSKGRVRSSRSQSRIIPDGTSSALFDRRRW
jgi:hypothetical protein